MKKGGYFDFHLLITLGIIPQPSFVILIPLQFDSLILLLARNIFTSTVFNFLLFHCFNLIDILRLNKKFGCVKTSLIFSGTSKRDIGGQQIHIMFEFIQLFLLYFICMMFCQYICAVSYLFLSVFTDWSLQIDHHSSINSMYKKTFVYSWGWVGGSNSDISEIHSYLKVIS